MRILAVSNLYPPGVVGGYELMCAQVAEALAALRHEVLVLTAQPGIAAPDAPEPGRPVVARHLALAPIFDPAQVAAHSIPALQALEARSQWIDAHNAGALVDAVERFRPDVAYLWNTVGVGGLGLLGTLKALGVPWVWHLSDRVPFQLCSERGYLLPPLGTAFLHHGRGNYIALSDVLIAELGGLGVPLRGNVTKLPAWADTEDVPVRLTTELGDPLRLAFAGQVGAHKGADIAVDVVIELHRRGIAATLDLWGEVLDLSLPGRAWAAGLGDNVTFHGPTPHARVLEGVAGCDLLLFPTWPREPFGMVPAEAAAVGTPPILSHCGAAEWLHDGVHALHAPRSVEGFVEAVLRVVDGQVDVAALARQAAARVRSDLSLTAAVPVIEARLQEAARPCRVSPARARRAYNLALVGERLVGDLVGRRWS